ncbi:hypothetical protein TorRG33x02_118460 [Trema orientale]|uniref:Uncharacterized protein n=1 Tax=Trema orientale TaxID=63057 RepID=A0A2P5F3I2_TREOI|nr:hypothetical protein TorRG33x02_118460 [Trema orientale]
MNGQGGAHGHGHGCHVGDHGHDGHVDGDCDTFYSQPGYHLYNFRTGCGDYSEYVHTFHHGEFHGFHEKHICSPHAFHNLCDHDQHGRVNVGDYGSGSENVNASMIQIHHVHDDAPHERRLNQPR